MDDRELLELAAKAMGYTHTADKVRSDLWLLMDDARASETNRT